MQIFLYFQWFFFLQQKTRENLDKKSKSFFQLFCLDNFVQIAWFWTFCVDIFLWIWQKICKICKNSFERKFISLRYIRISFNFRYRKEMMLYIFLCTFMALVTFVESVAVTRGKQDAFSVPGIPGNMCQAFSSYWKTETSCMCQYNTNTFYNNQQSDYACKYPTAGRVFFPIVLIWSNLIETSTYFNENKTEESNIHYII